MRNFEGVTVADEATGRPMTGVPVKLFDAETDAPIQAYRDGEPVQLVSNRHGYVSDFQTDDTVARVRLEAGPGRAYRWAVEVLLDGAEGAQAAASAAQDAATAAGEARTAAEAAASLVDAPADEVMATTLANPASQSHARLIAAIAESTPDVSAQLADTARIAVHGEDANSPRPTGTRPVEWFGTVEPVNMADGDVWHQFAEPTPPFTLFYDFSTYPTGTTDQWGEGGWTKTADATAAGGQTLTTTATTRKALALDESSASTQEIVARVKHSNPTTGGLGPGVILRLAGPDASATGYAAFFRSNAIALAKYNNGAYSPIKESALTVAADEWWWVRLRAEDSTLSVRAWKDGTTEPTTWTTTATDATITGPGLAGIVHATAGGTKTWDLVGYAADGATAPKGA